MLINLILIVAFKPNHIPATLLNPSIASRFATLNFISPNLPSHSEISICLIIYPKTSISIYLHKVHLRLFPFYVLDHHILRLLLKPNSSNDEANLIL